MAQITAMSTAIDLWLPSGVTLRSCSTRSRRACRAQRHVADLVEEQGAAIGLHDLADGALAARAGEGAVLVAEQLGLDQRLRDRQRS